MLVVRPMRLDDEEAYVKFAETASLGITSLPNDREVLHGRLLNSIDSFGKEVTIPGKELYLFVLEETHSHQKEGTSDIAALIDPIYFYHIETLYHNTSTLPLPPEIRVLHAVKHKTGTTEIGGLYLLPEYRGQHGGGLLLSLSRFLFMACFPQRFDQTVISNMRGVIDDGHTPFWDAVGYPFIQMDFPEVMRRMIKDREFVGQFIPKYPIYVSLLPPEVQECIGKTHPHTTAALNILTREGFRFLSEVDIFDGGPIYSASRDQIRSVRESRLAAVGKVVPRIFNGHLTLICNNRIDFRACSQELVELAEDRVEISAETAEALQVKEGDTVRYLHYQKKSELQR
jgi:arginine N-succinyltransferase